MTEPFGPITDPDPLVALRAWFAQLSDCCARVDYASARAIFADDVTSFGTKAEVVTGLDRLQREQWEGIWPNIAGFRIDPASVRGGGSAGTAWGVATWTSTGFHEDGRPFDRPGRATVVLARRRARVGSVDVWVAVHTHFSLAPGIPARTFGRKL